MPGTQTFVKDPRPTLQLCCSGTDSNRPFITVISFFGENQSRFQGAYSAHAAVDTDLPSSCLLPNPIPLTREALAAGDLLI